eukprot:2105452-Alexandrium_andersonii.AAC.1
MSDAQLARAQDEARQEAGGAHSVHDAREAMRAQVGALDASGAHGASHGLSGRVGPATEPQPRPASSSGSSWLRDAGQ